MIFFKHEFKNKFNIFFQIRIEKTNEKQVSHDFFKLEFNKQVWHDFFKLGFNKMNENKFDISLTEVYVSSSQH